MNCPNSWSLRWIHVHQLPGNIAHWQRNSPGESHAQLCFEYSNSPSVPAHVHTDDPNPQLVPTLCADSTFHHSLNTIRRIWSSDVVIWKRDFKGGWKLTMIFVFSLLAVSDGSKKVPADQISVSSSGSSGSEMEDLSSPITLQVHWCLCVSIFTF